MDHPIRIWRKRAGITQAALAQLVDVKESTVSRWELWIRTARGAELRRLVDVTGLSVEEAIGFERKAEHGSTEERTGTR